jgi:hypothetical protein
MNKLVALLVLMLGLTANTIAADISDAFINCAVVKDDRTRLACYDKIRDDAVKAAQAENKQNSGYRPLKLVDLKVDVKTLIGKKVAVASQIQVIGEMAMLKSDELDMSPLFADFSKLSRDDRKKLASGCQVVLCQGIFYGVVRQLPLGVGVALEKVDWK